MSALWVVLDVVTVIAGLVCSFSTWFGNFKTDRWIIGFFWFGLAVRAAFRLAERGAA